MKTVYGIAKGTYSDYSVQVMCPSKEFADNLCELWNQGIKKTAEARHWPFEPDYYRVEEFLFVESMDDWKQQHRYAYYVAIHEHPDGKQEVADQQEDWFSLEDLYSAGECFDYQGEHRVWAKSERGYEAAKKICFDLIAQCKAKHK